MDTDRGIQRDERGSKRFFSPGRSDRALVSSSCVCLCGIVNANLYQSQPLPTTLSPREAIARGDSLLILFAYSRILDAVRLLYCEDNEIKQRFSGVGWTFSRQVLNLQTQFWFVPKRRKSSIDDHVATTVETRIILLAQEFETSSFQADEFILFVEVLIIPLL